MSFFSPDPQTSELEHILAHTHGAYESRIARRHNFELELLFGRCDFWRGTATQWLRFTFHDFITVDVSEGTGDIMLVSDSKFSEERTPAVRSMTTLYSLFLWVHESVRHTLCFICKHACLNLWMTSNFCLRWKSWCHGSWSWRGTGTENLSELTHKHFTDAEFESSRCYWTKFLCSYHG